MTEGRRAEALERARCEAEHPEATVDSLVRTWEVAESAGEPPMLEAIEARLRETWPDRPEGYLFSAHRLIAENRFQAALAEAAKAAGMTDYPGYVPKALGLAGRAQIGLGDPRVGLALVQQALALNPNQEDLLVLRRTMAASQLSPR
jgi:tetratricopeptide (TPR) repeat protein